MRLIDADEAIINFGFEWDDILPTRDEFVEFIKKQPTIEAEPVKHGTWKLVEFQSSSFGIDHVLMCTNCGFVHEYDAWFNRCPNCGARMESEGE